MPQTLNPSSSRQSDPAMEECLRDCQNCATVCLNMAATHCLEMGGKHVEPHHYRTMLDCAEICQTAANFMLRHSSLHAHVCRACAEVCAECARSCEEVGDMEKCVEACRKCSESCRTMARQNGLA